MKSPLAAPSLAAPPTAAAVECHVVGEKTRQPAAYLGEPTPNIDTASVDRNTRPHARFLSCKPSDGEQHAFIKSTNRIQTGLDPKTFSE